MNLLIRHTEYLLGRRNCVVLPGLGALICATDPARFDQRNPGMLVPPRRRVAFNSAITADDGALSASFCRGLGISVAEAADKVAESVDELRREIMLCGTASFGRLGFFRLANDGSIAFSSSKKSQVNSAFSGLVNVDVVRLKGNATREDAVVSARKSGSPAVEVKPFVVPAEQPADSKEKVCAESEPANVHAPRLSRWRKFRNGAAGVAASLAVIVTVALFLLNPIRMSNEPQKASIAPIPAASNAIEQTSVAKETPVRRLTIGLPEESAMVVSPEEIASRIEFRKNFIAGSTPSTAEQVGGTTRSNMEGRFCVIVASFPTMSQAKSYISSKGGSLDVLEKDGKCRVYSATAPTYEEANALRANCGVADAWVCRR